MRKVIMILGIACLSVSTIAQSSSENGNRLGLRGNKYLSGGFVGFGFIQDVFGFYEVAGGNSTNLDIGRMHRYQFKPRFALIGTVQYSYYNYKLHDAASEMSFNYHVLEYAHIDGKISKQAFRSHNISTSAGYRFYLVKPKRNDNNSGLFADVSLQGDWAFSRYYRLNHKDGSKIKRRDKDLFNPFSTSYIARIGWNRFSIYARYRVTDAFNSNHLFFDVPPLTIGVQFLSLNF